MLATPIPSPLRISLFIGVLTILGGQAARGQSTFGNQPAAITESGQATDTGQVSSTGRLFDRMTETIQGGMQQGSAEDFLLAGPEQWTSREGLTSSLQILILLTVLSLAPAILLMTTCYVRIIVVMGLLRQALGTGQLPPSQVITSISLFMTLFIMAPVWNEVYDKSIAPYTARVPR